jgi:hypothetical protein
MMRVLAGAVLFAALAGTAGGCGSAAAHAPAARPSQSASAATSAAGCELAYEAARYEGGITHVGSSAGYASALARQRFTAKQAPYAKAAIQALRNDGLDGRISAIAALVVACGP